MKVYAVFVSYKVAGQAGEYYRGRWIDSQWARHEAAEERTRELTDGFIAFRVHDYFAASITQLSVVDVEVSEPASDEEAQ